MADPRNKPIARNFTIITPAVASGFTITPDTAADWLIRALRFRLVTDVNIADRAVSIAVSSGGSEYLRLSASAVQAAVLTRIYGGTEGVSGGNTSGTFVSLDFPSTGFWLPNGHTLTVTVAAIQAGDQIDQIAGYRYEFPLGPKLHMWPFIPTLLEESS